MEPIAPVRQFPLAEGDYLELETTKGQSHLAAVAADMLNNNQETWLFRLLKIEDFTVTIVFNPSRYEVDSAGVRLSIGQPFKLKDSTGTYTLLELIECKKIRQ